jgi:hypothetical protein
MRLRLLFALGISSLVAAAACGSGDSGSKTPPGKTGGSAGSSASGGKGGSSGSVSGGAAGDMGGAGDSGGSSAGGTVGQGGTSGSGTSGDAGAPSTGGTSGSAGADSGGSAGTDTGGAGAGGSGPTCKAFGDMCLVGGECCSGTCNPLTNSCESSIVACGEAGDGCSAPTDCCDLRCEGGQCAAGGCVSDGEGCTDGAECCSTSCGVTDTCEPLNDSCKTAGNECTGNDQCCSHACVDGKCKLGASWCIQPGDICSRDQDCCTAECVMESGASVGTCAAPPEGPSFCGGVDGMVCDGCNGCCSRLCAPGPSGINICQPASGCHVTGDLCRKDADCCGGDPDSGLPGAGNVVCDIESGKTLGICRNPMSCSPQGNVCHYKADESYTCNVSSARANCCGALGAMSEGCQLDALGVPRCNGIDTCRAAGETCASADDCCDGVPCVPDAMGVLRCADIPDDDPKCIMAGGSCSINADCCPGTSCIRPPGSTEGTCSTPEGTGGTSGTGGAGGTGGTTGGTGGTTGGTGGTTGGSSGTGGTGTTCAEYGQICGAVDCCNDVPCNGGICRFFTP